MSADLLDVGEALKHARTHRGVSLATLSRAAPLLVVFLHRLDCAVCRATLLDVVRLRPRLEDEGAQIVLVHPDEDTETQRAFERMGLQDVAHVGDPGRWLHRTFRLRPGGPLEWMAHRLWTAETAPRCGDRAGGGSARVGDSPRLPGIFLVYREAIVHEYKQKPSEDRPEDPWLVSRRVLSLL